MYGIQAMPKSPRCCTRPVAVWQPIGPRARQSAQCRELASSQWTLLGERTGPRVTVAKPPRRRGSPTGVLHVMQSFVPCRPPREWPGRKLGSRRVGTERGGRDLGHKHATARLLLLRNKQGLILMMTASESEATCSSSYLAGWCGGQDFPRSWGRCDQNSPLLRS